MITFFSFLSSITYFVWSDSNVDFVETIVFESQVRRNVTSYLLVMMFYNIYFLAWRCIPHKAEGTWDPCVKTFPLRHFCTLLFFCKVSAKFWELSCSTLRFVSISEWGNKNIKYFISSSGNRIYRLSCLDTLLYILMLIRILI